MKHAGSSNKGWRSDALWWLVLGAAASILVIAAAGVASFSLSNVVVLVVSIFVATLVCPHELSIPWTQKKFSPRTIFAFWGTVWLGIPGGLILGTAASAAWHHGARSDRKRATTSIAVDVLAISASASVFVVAKSFFAGLSTVIFPSGLLIPNEVVIASLPMAATHLGVRILMVWVETRLSLRRELSDVELVEPVTYVASLVATFLLTITFTHFGVEFGLVVVPLAVIADFAYKLHLRGVAQHTREITDASRLHLATVEALATAIDARDQVGRGHVRRTQIYAVGIGRLMGLGGDDLRALEAGALLHDIGKLAVPDHILNKPGRLTRAEMEKMKIHSAIGASILEEVGFPYPVVPTVKHHHECWDGTGYPDGLKGADIPISARILSIADAFDTLRDARPFRPAVSREDACNFLRSRAGSQFDPNIVSTFLKNLRALELELEAVGLEYEPRDAEGQARPANDPIKTGYIEEIKRANREVFTLYELARDFGSSHTLEDALELFTAKVAEFVPFDTALVYLLDDSADVATAVHVHGQNRAALLGKQVRVGDGATGYVLKKCRPVENVDPSMDFAYSHTDLTKAYVAMASLPLFGDEKIIGAISIYSSELGVYEEEHLRLLETVSRIASDAIFKSLRHAETESYALTDPMTTLPNARSLQLQFDKEAARAKRSDGYFQMLVMDLDGFKMVNDTFGHKVGDRLLKAVGKVIGEELRDYDFLARYGGDEFIALIPDTHAADVVDLCRRIETAVDKYQMDLGDDMFAKVGVSIGSASFPNHGETFDQLIMSADKAMYATKAFHRKRNERLSDRDTRPVSDNVEDVAAEEVVEFAAAIYDDSVVLELDETHVVEMGLVN
jgi:diguanylate cyclase (GGDEF)-like protein/putative nucleotidyltransferase with HDIG domain